MGAIATGAAYGPQRKTKQPCSKFLAAAEAWACLREVARSSHGDREADDRQLLSAWRHAMNRTQVEHLAEWTDDGLQAADGQGGKVHGSTRGVRLNAAYVDVHSNRHGSNCGVMLFSERRQRPCSAVLRFHEVKAAVSDWELRLVAGRRPERCGPAAGQILCLDMEEALNTFELGWILALEADLIRVKAWMPWPSNLFSNYDILIFRVDELRLLQPVPTSSRPQLRLVVGTEPHIYGDRCDFRYRAFNDVTDDRAAAHLEAHGICPVLLDPFLVQAGPERASSGLRGVPHWWPMPLHIYRVAFPLDLSDGRRRDRRLLLVGTVNPHYTPTGSRACVSEDNIQKSFQVLAYHLPPEDGSGNGWQYYANTMEWSMWDFWFQIKAAKYIVLLPFARQSLGRAIAEAAAVAAVPVIGWRNKLFQRLLMPPILSVDSVTQAATTILHLEANPAEYDAVRHAIAARLRLVHPRSALSAHELAKAAQDLGTGHSLCTPWSTMPNSMQPIQGQLAAYLDPLDTALFFACTFLCRPSCPRVKPQIEVLSRTQTNCTSAPGPGWDARAGQCLLSHSSEQAVQEAAWWAWQPSPLRGVAIAALSVALVQLAQMSGEDTALALVFFRLSQSAVDFAQQLRAETEPQSQYTVDEILAEASRMIRLRNATADGWGKHLQSEGSWTYNVDDLVRHHALSFWRIARQGDP